MRALKKKLLGRAGETLTEVLIAILVVGMAISIMAGLIATSSRINIRARASEKELYEALNSAESADAELAGDAVLAVTVTPESGPVATVSFEDLSVCGAAGELYAYYWENGG